MELDHLSAEARLIVQGWLDLIVEVDAKYSARLSPPTPATASIMARIPTDPGELYQISREWREERNVYLDAIAKVTANFMRQPPLIYGEGLMPV